MLKIFAKVKYEMNT